jgi:hypothetical protein
MGDLIVLIPKPKRTPDLQFDDNIEDVIKEALAVSKEKFGREQGSIFELYGSFENLLRSKIGMTLLMEKPVKNVELFRCSLYVSEMLGEFLKHDFESYQVMDYLERGHDECEPAHFKTGGDLCFVLCTFFEGRCNRVRRPLKLNDYMDLGMRLYFAFHAETKNRVGLCMGENFREIVSLTKKSIRTL